MEYIVSAYTDTGIQRSSNQDSLCIRRASISGGEILMAVICDGMGGLQKGELASAECVRAFGAWFDQNMHVFPTLCRNNFYEIRRQWAELLLALHQKLLIYARERQIQIGTTVAAMLTFEDRCLIVNVGDSRIYERTRTLRQLTQDQSLVAVEIARGRITEEEAKHHPQRNILLQSLGAGEAVNPVFTEITVRGGALYLLCTDGLIHEISSSELKAQLEPLYLDSKERLTAVLIRLIETCKQRGETDNITAILFKAIESYSSTGGVSPLENLMEKMHIKSKKSGSALPTATLLETAQIEHTQEAI